MSVIIKSLYNSFYSTKANKSLFPSPLLGLSKKGITTIPRGRLIDLSLPPLRLGNPITFPIRWYTRRYIEKEGRRFMVVYHIIFIYMIAGYYREHQHLSIITHL